jgi:small subunit ribosomal protein S20
MPIKKSAFKALRQAKKRTLRNRLKKEKIKSLAKQIRRLLQENKLEEVKKLVPLFYKVVDKAAKTHTIAKNKANRLKSRLMTKINKLINTNSPDGKE